MRLTDYRGKTAFVTGASSGIGRLLAVRLAAAGADVALVARREAELARTAADVERHGRRAVVLPCDVADRRQVFAAAERALAALGHVDILVNNAGYGRHRRFLEWDVADIERLLQVNFLGAVYATKALLPQMVARQSGWIVFMASVAGRIGVPDESAYAASKFALVGLAEALSIEVEEAGVHVLTVCPGAVATDFFDAEALARLPPVARRTMLPPERVVDAVLAALARGRREVTVPGFIRAGYLAKAIAPGFVRRNTRRATIGARGRGGGPPPRGG